MENEMKWNTLYLLLNSFSIPHQKDWCKSRFWYQGGWGGQGVRLQIHLEVCYSGRIPTWNKPSWRTYFCLCSADGVLRAGRLDLMLPWKCWARRVGSWITWLPVWMRGAAELFCLGLGPKLLQEEEGGNVPVPPASAKHFLRHVQWFGCC